MHMKNTFLRLLRTKISAGWLILTAALSIAGTCFCATLYFSGNTQEPSLREQSIAEKKAFQIDGITMDISDISINEELKTIQLNVTYSKDGKCPDNPTELPTAYPLSLRVREQSNRSDETGYTVFMTGFYEDINQLNNLSITDCATWESHDYSPTVTVKRDIPSKKFDVMCKDVNLQVAVTPFSVIIMPEQAQWREENDFYRMVAVMQDGSRQSITPIPWLDTRKPSVKEKAPVLFDKEETLPTLGGGISEGLVRKDNGLEWTTEQEIDIEKIASVQLKKIH